MSTLSSVSGVNVDSIFNNCLEGISKKGEELQNELEKLKNGKELSSEDLLQIQFKLGEYNTLIESASTITKNLTDSMKSIAQRAG